MDVRFVTAMLLMSISAFSLLLIANQRSPQADTAAPVNTAYGGPQARLSPIAPARLPGTDAPSLPPVTAEHPNRSVDPYAAIDRLLAKLDRANIEFDVPRYIDLDDSRRVHLVLGIAAPAADRTDMITPEDGIDARSIRVAERMEARLSGSNFTVAAIFPEVQPVLHNGTTQWTWEISPRQAGPQHLHLSLSARISVDGISTQKAIRSFNKIVEVELTPRMQLIFFLKHNWHWLWAALLLPVTGWLLLRWRRASASA